MATSCCISSARKQTWIFQLVFFSFAVTYCRLNVASLVSPVVALGLILDMEWIVFSEVHWHTCYIFIYWSPSLFRHEDWDCEMYWCGTSAESLKESILINSETGSCCVINWVLSTVAYCLNVMFSSVTSNLLCSNISTVEIPGQSVHRCNIHCLLLVLQTSRSISSLYVSFQQCGTKAHFDESCTHT